MTRLPLHRDTHLSPEEIAAETLRQFDEGATAPSIRHLARALDVAPSAIYHHFPSRAAIYDAASGLVWQQAMDDLVADLPDPFAVEPVEALVAAAVATRAAFLRHHRITPHIATNPSPTGAPGELPAGMPALIAGLVERLGLEQEEAAACLHTYASMMLGAVIIAASRKPQTPARDAELFAIGLRRLVASFAAGGVAARGGVPVARA
jgi:AcrR family transcriptional regulator